MKSVLIYYFKYCHNWFFETTTRIMEVFNCFGLMSIGYIFLVNNEYIVGLPSYHKFAYIAPPSYWSFVILLGILQLTAVIIPSLRANQVSGMLMMLSAIFWGLLSLAFTYDLDKFTTAPVIYGLMSFFIMMTGIRLLLSNRALEEKYKQKL